ncbi:adenylate/guanylate cyclase domain-containing protein [Nocardioides cavernae]|uniref:Adenylate/guanylate cyclase domain-containing protein n=1 Tax=Nocardioides cavernae TaxID=1921566 RepID=A0ABR8NBE1_9ACTN|nr:adenylate/guanylate cyclase domain-containing protein [Nocardioides cavernae]MBD3925195.1 adenylate/guanylate cyclase domain-containing protein [Nocardioides cavernae]MBM7514427.1 adenylate cyclase [Nocardioides cavernae]
MAPDRKRRAGLPGTGPQGAPGEQLDHAILRSEPAFNALEVAAETGVTIEQTRRLWRALGFPEFSGEKAYTAADIKAVSTLMGFVDSGAVDFDTAVNLTRGVGQTMARLADWEVSTLVSRVEEMEAGEEATGSRIGSALRLIDEVNPPFERLLVYAWRRHLAAAVGRIEAMGAKDEDLHTIDVSVGFADLVSFTALSNTLDRDEIGDLVEVFESRCQDVVARYGGRIIKSLGDSVLFVTNTAEEAVSVAEGIINVIGRDPKMPDVRLGLASGPVVQRLGDIFGPPVNMAARLTQVARRNRLIVDQNTADLLPDEDWEDRRLPARPVRGFGLVEPVAVRRR